MRKLQDILDGMAFEDVPPAWTTFDLAAFSRSKKLWDYQRMALQNALKALWKYYEDFANYQYTETVEVNSERKRLFFRWYRDNGLEGGLDIPVDSARRDICRLLKDYYHVEEGRISYEHFINRIGFWMATGSGKTLVIVKLLELLWRLIRLREIPPSDILVLTQRDDLIKQLHLHVDEFNAARSELFIRLRDLREYPEAKRETLSLFKDQELTVFCYRSDNLSDEQKEKILDFCNYDDDGRWYILLDEAHKGDKEDSKRQHIYSILARNGFLFNFSATFTDPRDILTTAFDFNLARFIAAGYGKHISILKQENRAFRDEEDYTGEEKQKVVLKSLLMLAYTRKAREDMARAAGRDGLYHKPLLLTLVNSVNVRDADLKLFFRQIERIGKREVALAVLDQARDELWKEFTERPELLFEHDRFTAYQTLFRNLTYQDILTYVYNAPGAGEIEVLVRPSNRQELAFKLKSAERPFALIKIGDISGWLKEELAGYDVIEGFEDESFFERLNADDSDINILMGSRSFYEGWDSNRPNVITFINIGTGTDARKFILQSIGRGVRIEPLKGKRRRLLPLYNNREIGEELFRQIIDHTLPLETLFIFGTNRNALKTIIETVDLEAGKEEEHELALDVNEEAVQGRTLLIPVYRRGDRPLIEQSEPRKFPIAVSELELLKGYLEYLDDDRLLLTYHNATPRQVGLMYNVMGETDRYFNTSNGKRYGNLDLILPRLFGYMGMLPEEFEGLKPLADEIRHFRHIKVLLRDISELQAAIEKVTRYPQLLRELRARYEAQQLSFDEFFDQAQGLRLPDVVYVEGKPLEVRRVAKHYYIPVILTVEVMADYIRHVIKTPSEIRFVKDLEAYLNREDNQFKQFDWWLFSKLDEALDQVYIPYYDPDANRIRQFKPDFIFWLQKGDCYSILFIDPKGTEHTAYEHKIDWYRWLFEQNGEKKVFNYNGLKVRVFTFLYTQDVSKLPDGYKKYWFDNIDKVLGQALGM
ncbi:MAG: restriction endonuclease subunit R [Ammonifex sp.]|jgi:superfamily II DNA or RNA helicase|nr:MAG: restriction endonuclease subunit R [Ammonifex sp.]